MYGIIKQKSGVHLVKLLVMDDAKVEDGVVTVKTANLRWNTKPEKVPANMISKDLDTVLVMADRLNGITRAR